MKHDVDVNSLLAKGEQELETIEGLLRRLKLGWMLRHFPPRLVWAGFVCVNCLVIIALLSAVAMVSGAPLVFPSLGPTAYLLFFTPRQPAASPKHTICGHLIGLICGWGALWATGLLHAPSVTAEGVLSARVIAAAVSLGVTGALMVLLSVGHPPAGATTLIVSLGFITQPRDLFVIEAAVVALVIYAIAVNRLAGVDYPLWFPRKHPTLLPRPPVA